MTRHPHDRRERYIIEQKKQKRLAEERASRVWRKFKREEAKKQESEDDLKAPDRDVDGSEPS